MHAWPHAVGAHEHVTSMSTDWPWSSLINTPGSSNATTMEVSETQSLILNVLLISISTLCATIISLMTLVVVCLIITLIHKWQDLCNQQIVKAEAQNLRHVYAELEPNSYYEEVREENRAADSEPQQFIASTNESDTPSDIDMPNTVPPVYANLMF